MLAIPKRPRAAVQRSDSIAEVLTKAHEVTTRVATARVVAAKAGDLTAKNLQALLDQSMREFLPTLPRMIVTAKAFGVFRKRVQASNIDLAKFVTFCIREWSTLAAQNRMAFVRDPSKAQKGSPIPPGPSFSVWAYRLPYFIAAYGSTEAIGARLVKGDSPDAARIKRLEAEVAKLQSENTAVRAIIRRSKPMPRPEPLRGETKSARHLDTDVNWTPPAWAD